MGLIRRVLSASYRQALSAEAAGDYIAAARAYALCGERLKVAEMQLCEAERLAASDRREAVDGRLGALRAAAHWTDDRSEAGRALLRRIGRAYLDLLRLGVLAGRDQQLHREAAELLRRGGDAAGAGEAYELLGDAQQAAEAYKEAGDVERVEALLGREERRRQRDSEERDLFARYQMYLLLGRRDEARAALRACVQAAQDPAEPRRLLDELEGRLLTGGAVRLRRGGGAPTLHAGRFPILLGRGAECQLVLRDAGVSRTHASISAGPAPPGAPQPYALRDLGSRNGTTLNGLAVGGELPLRGEGEIGIGEGCTLRFRVERAQLHLCVVRGMDRGASAWASPLPLPILSGVELRFEEGRPLLRAEGPLLLNGQRAPAAVQLIIGDVIEVEGERLEVVP